MMGCGLAVVLDERSSEKHFFEKYETELIIFVAGLKVRTQ